MEKKGSNFEELSSVDTELKLRTKFIWSNETSGRKKFLFHTWNGNDSLVRCEKTFLHLCKSYEEKYPLYIKI